jgi:MgtC family
MGTHGMVALGAALFTVASLYGFAGSADPARVAAQIVSGVGFLGDAWTLHLSCLNGRWDPRRGEVFRFGVAMRRCVGRPSGD